MEGPVIRFPNLGIEIEHLSKSISIFGFEIAWYGIIIGCGMIAGIILACAVAKRTRQNPENYFDFAIYAIICAIVGARIYYVVFSWDYYKDNLLEILNLRNGGLAIYGGIIAAVICLIVYTRIKKLSFWQMADTGCLGLALGQVIGRWGNFVNREAFGGYSDGLLAMQIRLDEASYTTPELMDKLVHVGGADYIQVQPTFLYESLWNLGLLCLLLLYNKHKRFHGETFLLYLCGYGVGRFWIEALRTDQLLLPIINIPVSRVLAGVLVVGSLAVIIIKRMRLRSAGIAGAVLQREIAAAEAQAKTVSGGEKVEDKPHCVNEVEDKLPGGEKVEDNLSGGEKVEDNSSGGANADEVEKK